MKHSSAVRDHGVAQARFDAARVMLDKSFVRSPVAGVVPPSVDTKILETPIEIESARGLPLGLRRG